MSLKIDIDIDIDIDKKNYRMDGTKSLLWIPTTGKTLTSLTIIDIYIFMWVQ